MCAVSKDFSLLDQISCCYHNHTMAILAAFKNFTNSKKKNTKKYSQYELLLLLYLCGAGVGVGFGVVVGGGRLLLRLRHHQPHATSSGRIINTKTDTRRPNLATETMLLDSHTKLE